MNNYKGLSYNAYVGAYLLGHSLLGYTGATDGAIFTDLERGISATSDLPVFVEAGEEPLAVKHDLANGGVKRIVNGRREVRRFVVYVERAAKSLLENVVENAEKVSYLVKVDDNVEDYGEIIPNKTRTRTKTGRVYRVDIEGYRVG